MDDKDAANIIVETLIKAAINKNVLDELDEYEQLENELPEHIFSDDFNERMREEILKDKKKRYRKKAVSFTARAAIIVLVFVISSTAIGILTVQAFRERFFNMIENFRKEYFTLIPIEVNEPFSDLESLKEKLITTLPDDFEKTDEHTGKYMIILRFESTNGYLKFIANTNDDSVNNANIENASYEKITINSKTIYFVEGEDNTVLWYDSNYTYSIYSTLEKNIIIDIINKLTK